ncbi:MULTISPECIES: ATP-binding protein [unclassified Oceanispirochaeta]|uniref:ATP-binding protein n=1 Tax=unclassified Oceanispirochaeta TaxID=2635722 RepID=UPI000E09184D|nr:MULTISPECIES: ATP-binding protein [unclassified Oceanispirochaeta]MBF9017395.1 Hpt domain-containing protein [Oceanispirochaeta sp. M2]NPD73769.1 HAMP domain-containing protein [Oceanispirochaeta sp. M1]RDG30520.1 HAMP domain-containing protein [Oceanispirochaeta sp. M1]
MKLQSIQVKIVSMILLVMIFAVSLSISFAIRTQKQNLIEASQQTLAVNTQVLNHTIRNIMLSGEAPLANKTMKDLRSMPEFLEYEIYRKDGSLAFSDYNTLQFVNNFQDRIMFEETPRLEGSMNESTSFQEVLRFKTPKAILNEETREMEYFFPILNYADCRSCHGDDHFIRGVSHFRISLSDIYDKVASARLILTLFFLGIGLFIFIGILLMLRHIIIRPVLSIGNVVSRVGEGDLDVDITLNQRDELGELAGRINDMIKGLKNSKKLELENTRIEARLKESRKYLDNINEGLLLLNPDFTITDEYSSYLKELFEKKEISGISFRHFLLGSDQENEEAVELDQFLKIIFNNQTASMSMIMEINPLSQREIILPSGKKLIISAHFQRIVEGDTVQNVMVLFQDLTEIYETKEALETERQIHESELEQIAAILKLGPQVFEEFLVSAGEVLQFVQDNSENFEKTELINKAFRDTHSLKGSARYLKFTALEKIAHNMENYFDKFRKSGADSRKIESSELIEQTKALSSELNSINRIIERFRQFSVNEGSDNPELDIFRLQLSEMVEELSQELGKDVQLDFHSDWEIIPGLRRLQNSIFHLVRNALDHGIEDSFERLAAEKPEASILTLNFIHKEDSLILEVKDDGRGLDFNALEKKAVESGLLKPGRHFPSQILNALFKPGFSSSEDVSEISGRGVGLDAVKEEVKGMKGKINVKTRIGKGTSFNLILPLKELEDK